MSDKARFRQSRAEMLERLLPLPESFQPRDADHVDPHLISVIILLATRPDVLAAVFPPHGGPNPQPLLDMGVEAGAATVASLQPLKRYYTAFSSMQDAWMTFSNYQDPPCLRDKRIKSLVKHTIDLRNVPNG